MLAAGRSTRAGGVNKLTAKLAGESVIAHTVDAALASRAATAIVVTGHQAARVRAALAGRDVELAHNRDYARGLSSSLRRGLEALEQGGRRSRPTRSKPKASEGGPLHGWAIEGALICLGDMPWVRAADLDALIAAFARADRPICVPVRGRRRGNPVLWPARHFAALRALQGDTGGRGLLRRYAREVVRVPMPDAGVTRDVDTLADLGSR